MPLPIVETQLKRFDADSADREAVVKDLRKNSESMGVWSGSACVFEACHKFNGVLASVENFTHVVLQLKDYNGNAAPSADSAALVEVIVEAADFDTTVDDASAADFSKAHFKFALTDEQMAQTDTKWLLCFARTISGNTVTLRAGTLVFTQDGGPSVTAPDPVASSAWTKGEADARFLQTANNLSDLEDVPTARTNLGIESEAEAAARYLQIANNLSEIDAAGLVAQAAARVNIGVEIDVRPAVAISAAGEIDLGTWVSTHTIIPITVDDLAGGNAQVVLAGTNARGIVELVFSFAAGTGSAQIFDSAVASGHDIDLFLLQASASTASFRAYFDPVAAAWKRITSKHDVP
jgi:hypothetical protein